MLLNEIIEPIESFKSYSFGIDRTIQTGQNNNIAPGQFYDTNAAGQNIYGGDAGNARHYLQGFSYADFLKFWFTIYRAEIFLNYNIQNKKTERTWNFNTSSYDDTSFVNNIFYSKNVIYHFASGSYTNPDPNPEIYTPIERTCKDFGNGSNTWDLIPTIEPNLWAGSRNVENVNFNEATVLNFNNSLSLGLNFNSTYTPNPTEPDFLKRTSTFIGNVAFQYDNNGIEKNPIKYLDFTATWETTTGQIIKEWTGGKIPVGYNGWTETKGGFNQSEILSAAGSINYKFTSFDFLPTAPTLIQVQ